MKYFIISILFLGLKSTVCGQTREFKPTIGFGYNYILHNPEFVNTFPNTLTANAGFMVFGKKKKGCFVYDYYYNKRTFNFIWPDLGNYTRIEQNFGYQINYRIHLGNLLKNYFHFQFGAGMLFSNTKTASGIKSLDSFVRNSYKSDPFPNFTIGFGYSIKMKKNRMILFIHSAFGRLTPIGQALTSIAGVQFAFGMKKQNENLH